MIATKGGGQPLPLMTLCSMNGIFHRLVQVAAGEILCPFNRKRLDTAGGASCVTSSGGGVVGC